TLAEEFARIAVELAVDSVEIARAVQILRTNRVAGRERMRRRQDDHHLLAKEGHRMHALLVRLVRQTIDCDFKLTLQEPPAELLCAGINDRELDAGAAAGDRLQEIDQLSGRNRTHDADSQRRLLETTEVRRKTLGSARLIVHALQMRHHDAPQLR